MTARKLRIRALLPMACDGVGPSYTCTSLLRGMACGGASVRLYANRRRVALTDLDSRIAVPGPLSYLPYRVIRQFASRDTEKAFLRHLEDGEVAYLWPQASLRTHELVHRRGNPIVLEGINTRMAFAKEVLDAAYAAEGLEPRHEITDRRIAEEEQKLELARAIFAPSRGVEVSLQGTSLSSGGIIAASYGGHLADDPRTRRRQPDGKPVFLFVGLICIRKGVHQLLRAWRDAKINGTLVLAGSVEPAVQEICSEELNRPDVRCVGFVRDVKSLYRAADVFVLPSFEEGDPLVTYEAASFGLPIVASAMGAGRIGEKSGCAVLVDPTEADTITTAMRRLAKSRELRQEFGKSALAAMKDYQWSDVGAARAAKLDAMLQGTSRYAVAGEQTLTG